MTTTQLAYALAPKHSYFTGPAAPYVYAPDRLLNGVPEMGPFRYEPRFAISRGRIIEVAPLMRKSTIDGFVIVDNPGYEAAKADPQDLTRVCRSCGKKTILEDGRLCIDCMPF